MNEIERIVEAERRKGWSVTLTSCLAKGWTCGMDCGVDVLDAHLPRPVAGGETQMIALTLAIRERDRMFAELKSRRERAA